MIHVACCKALNLINHLLKLLQCPRTTDASTTGLRNRGTWREEGSILGTTVPRTMPRVTTVLLGLRSGWDSDGESVGIRSGMCASNRRALVNLPRALPCHVPVIALKCYNFALSAVSGLSLHYDLHVRECLELVK